MVDVIVIGAGTSGLAAADALLKLGLDTLVLEARPRAGGDIRTIEVKDFLFETGPWAVRADDPSFEELVRGLGMEQRVVRSDSHAARWYALKDETLWPVPRSASELLRSPLLSLRGRLRALAEPVLVGREELEGGARESDLRGFLIRRLGDEAGELYAELLARSTHGSTADALGTESAFPTLVRRAEERMGVVGDLLSGDGTTRDDVLSFHGGLSALVDALTRSLGRHLSLSSPVAELQRGAGGWRVTLESGESLSAGQIVLAVPAVAAYPLLAMCAPERLELDELREVEHERITNVHLGLDGVSLLPGRGIVTAPGQRSKDRGEPSALLGAVFHSNLFPGRAPSGTAAVSCSYRAEDVVDVAEAALPERALRDLVQAVVPAHAGSPCNVVAWYVRTLEVPRLGVGHAARMERVVARVQRALPGLHLTGSFLGGIEVASRVMHARGTAALALELVQRRPGVIHKASPRGSAAGTTDYGAQPEHPSPAEPGR
ncbi:MAG: protoporphyrinogen oxidase [Planctomycetota bacterium]